MVSEKREEVFSVPSPSSRLQSPTMSHTDPLAATIATYDQNADVYVARNRRNASGEMARHFEQFARFVPHGGLVLDVGCGPGQHSLELLRRGYRTLSLDLSRGMLHEAQKAGASDLALADMRRLPIASASADGLWVSASFLHVPRADAPARVCARAENRRCALHGRQARRRRGIHQLHAR